MPSSVNSKCVCLHNSGFVTLFTCHDVGIDACGGRLYFLLDLDLIDKQVVAISVCVWILMTVNQVIEQLTLVMVRDKTTLLDCQRVQLLTQMKNLLIKISHQITKQYLILQNT